ncbi:hypothetical protein CP061683_1066C, partial [Chlamydia psittaci 06-1683]
LKGQLLAIATH